MSRNMPIISGSSSCNEPRGKVNQCVNLVLPPTTPEADAGFVIIEADYYVPMSGTNTICTVTALLETGMIPMQEPVTKLTLEAPAGLVPVTAECRDGKCVSVTFDNVPGFVFVLDGAGRRAGTRDASRSMSPMAE